MSVQPAGEGAGLPAVNQASEPAWVRHGSASVQKEYASALSFEQTLVEQLSKSLVSTSGVAGQGEGEGGEEGGSSSEAGGTMLSSLLPQALAGGLVRDGGLGLAAQLTRGLAGLEGSAAGRTGTAGRAASEPTTGATGGTGA